MANDFDLANFTPEQLQTLLNGPALGPPTGVLPNFTNPPNENTLGYALLIACASLCAIMVGIRVYAKAVCLKKMDIEDYLVVAALGVFAGFLYISYQIVVMPGLFVHQWNVRLKDLAHILYNVNTNYILYGNIIMLLKAGILLEWTHLFVPRGVHNSFWWTCHILIWVNVLFYISCTIVENFSCSPREKIWNKMVPGHCVNNPAVITSSGILNLVSDLLIFALPQKMIWGLRISTRKRAGVLLIFGMGLFGCICGAFRLWSSIRALNADDITFMVGPIGLWSLGEVTSGFVILCIPSLPKVFRDSTAARKVADMVKSWIGSSNAEKVNSRLGLPSWYRSKSAVRPKHTDLSELNSSTTRSFRTDSRSMKSGSGGIITWPHQETILLENTTGHSKQEWPRLCYTP